MAARASARTSPKGESKQGLVVTLVFFVLATIGLGVSTYFGFSEQEDLRKKAEDSDNKQKAEAKLIDFYKFQSNLDFRASKPSRSSAFTPLVLEMNAQYNIDWNL